MANYSKSTYLQNMVLNATLRSGTFTAPSSVFLALATANPTEAGTAGVEVSAPSYSRIAVSFDPPTPTSGSGTGASCKSLQDTVFPKALEDWTTGSAEIEYAMLYDASSGGNMLYYGELVAPKPIGEGDRMTFEAGDVIVIED